MGENMSGRENAEPSDAQNAAGAGSGSNDNKKKSSDTKIGLTLRILVSVYVLYLAFGLIQGFGETTGNDRIFIAAAIVVFVAAGGAILIFSAKKLIRKEYVDADGQTGEDEEQ